MNVLLTGSTGFIGSVLLDGLLDKEIDLTTVSRSSIIHSSNVKHLVIDLANCSDWSFLFGKDVVVHLAGLNHVISDVGTLKKQNLGVAIALGAAAIEYRVKRLIYISTIKVHGEHFADGYEVQPDSPANPQDDYAASKWQAEQALRMLLRGKDVELVVIRPPLVYGPGAGENFMRLVSLAKSNIPLPFGEINNRRSMLSVLNLTDFIIKCLDHKNAAGETFVISDKESYSTHEIMARIRRFLGLEERIFSFPPVALSMCLKIFGLSDVESRLFGSLVIDSSLASEKLDWQPHYSLEDTLKKM